MYKLDKQKTLANLQNVIGNRATIPEMKDPFSNSRHPRILYKYRNFHIDPLRQKSHLDDLINSELFFPSPHNFNDPFDCDIPINYSEFVDNPQAIEKFVEIVKSFSPELFENKKFSEIVKNVLSSNTLTNRDFIQAHTTEMRDQLKSDFGIFSASAKFDNSLMWSHYSRSHSGFCFGLDTKQIIANHTINGISRVKYSKKYPLVSPLAHGLEQLRLQLLHKSTDWQYEKEFRILLLKKPNSIMKISPDYITAIYLGLNISKEDKEKLLSYRTSHFPHVKFYDMVKAENEFKLTPKEI